MDKNKIFFNNFSSSIFWRILTMLLAYLSIPYLLKYLGSDNYGLWITIFSILNTAYFMDLGIALGLKNYVTEAINNNNYSLAKKYISTAYITIGSICILMFVMLVFSIHSFSMQTVFNVTVSEKTLKTILYLSSFFVLMSVVLNIYKSVFMSFQESKKVEKVIFVYQLLVFVSLIIIPFIIKESLIAISIIYGFSNIIVALSFSFYFFKKNNEITPSFRYFDKNKIKKIMGRGTQFFIIQLSLIIILSTDNYLITKFINTQETTTYSLINKLFQLFLTVSTLVFTPLWTLYTTAYQSHDFNWIKQTFVKLNYLFIVLIIGIILFILFLPWILRLWLHQEISFQPSLVYVTALFVLIRIYGDIYMTFLNGIGKIQLQMWLYVFGAIINIPLSIFFMKHLHLGSTGVILATCISLLALTFVMPIQSYNIINEK